MLLAIWWLIDFLISSSCDLNSGVQSWTYTLFNQNIHYIKFFWKNIEFEFEKLFFVEFLIAKIFNYKIKFEVWILKKKGLIKIKLEKSKKYCLIFVIGTDNLVYHLSRVHHTMLRSASYIKDLNLCTFMLLHSFILVWIFLPFHSLS